MADSRSFSVKTRQQPVKMVFHQKNAVLFT